MDPPAENGVLLDPDSRFTPEQPLLLGVTINPVTRTVEDVQVFNCPAIAPGVDVPLERVHRFYDQTRRCPVERNATLADLFTGEPERITTVDGHCQASSIKLLSLEKKQEFLEQKRQEQQEAIQTAHDKMHRLRERVNETTLFLDLIQNSIREAQGIFELATTAAEEAHENLVNIEVDWFRPPAMNLGSEIHQLVAIQNETNRGQFIESYVEFKNAKTDKEQKEKILKIIKEESLNLAESLRENRIKLGLATLDFQQETQKYGTWMEACEQIRGELEEAQRQQRQEQRQERQQLQPQQQLREPRPPQQQLQQQQAVREVQVPQLQELEHVPRHLRQQQPPPQQGGNRAPKRRRAVSE